MYFLSSFSDTTKDVDFRRKVADDSRIQGVCHVNFIFFGYSLVKIKLCQVSLLWDMCDQCWPPPSGGSPRGGQQKRVKTSGDL